MAYGPVMITDIVTTDLVAPGAPIFISIQQISNVIVRVICSIPTMDADGNNLTGLKKLTVVTAPMAGGFNPFSGLGMSEILVVPAVVKIDVTLTESDAGTQKSVDMPVVNLGGAQALAAACSD